MTELEFPVLIEEGVTFKTIIPVASNGGGVVGGAVDGTIGGAIGGAVEEAFAGATKVVKEKLIILLTAIYSNEGKRTPDLNKIWKGSERSLERYLKQLKDVDLIEFKGYATQAGGYYLTKKMKEKLK